MPNPYYTEAFSGQPGQTARAESVTSEFLGVQAGFDGVSADINRSIKGAANETLNALPVAASRANKWVRFDSAGQPIVVNAPFNWRGYWAPSTLYYVGDVVQIGVHKSLVYCTVQHTSGLTYAGTNWSLFIDLTGVMFTQYYLITAAGSTQLATGDAAFIDSTAGAATLLLPASPNLGDSPVTVTYVAGPTSSVTISAGTNKIMGTTDGTMVMDVTNFSVTLSWAGAAYGWRARTMG